MSIIEGILFAAGEAVHINDIADTLNEDVKKIKKILMEMKDIFNYERRGIQIKRIGDQYQLATRSEHYEYIKKIMVPQTSVGLSRAALETLAIIAYKQPITRIEIEEIRGVKCERSLQTLLDKSLIDVIGRQDSPGKPLIYATTDEFLKHVGIETLDQLPKIEEEGEDYKNLQLMVEDLQG